MIDQSHFETEPGDLLLGRAVGRSGPDDVTLFKSAGVAVQDLYAATRAVGNVRQLGLGTRLS